MPIDRMVRSSPSPGGSSMSTRGRIAALTPYGLHVGSELSAARQKRVIRSTSAGVGRRPCQRWSGELAERGVGGQGGVELGRVTAPARRRARAASAATGALAKCRPEAVLADGPPPVPQHGEGRRRDLGVGLEPARLPPTGRPAARGRSPSPSDGRGSRRSRSAPSSRMRGHQTRPSSGSAGRRPRSTTPAAPHDVGKAPGA